MKKNIKTDGHLTEVQIFQMLLDPSDLSETRKAHLAACSHCRAALEGLRDDLHQIENMALTTAPKSVGPIHLTARQASNPLTFFTGMRPLARLAVFALALVLVVGTVLFLNPGQKNHTVSDTHQTVDPELLLSEIDELVETPFAPEFQVTTSTSEIDGHEDFMQYIVPAIETDPITRSAGKKGESIC